MSKSVTRSFRLDHDLETAIQERAKGANTSVNFLVNRLIRKYVEWDLPAEKFGLGPVAASLVNDLFEDIEDKSAYDLGRRIAHEFFEPFSAYLFGDLTLETSIMLFRRASEYGGRYSFDSNSDKRHQILVLRHNGGHKVSKFYSGVFQGIYSEILGMKIEVESTKDYCVVKLPAVGLPHRADEGASEQGPVRRTNDS